MGLVDYATTLLHLPALGHVIWKPDDTVEKIKRTWVRGKYRNSVRIEHEGKRPSPPRIRIRPAPRRV